MSATASRDHKVRTAFLTCLSFLISRIVRVKLYQAFLLSGGPNGRLSRGDELIEMEFMGMGDGDHEFLEAPTSL